MQVFIFLIKANGCVYTKNLPYYKMSLVKIRFLKSYKFFKSMIFSRFEKCPATLKLRYGSNFGSSEGFWAMNESLTQRYRVDDEGYLVVKSKTNKRK